MTRNILTIFVLIVVFFTTSSNSFSSSQNEITILINRYFDNIDKSDYLKAAGLFHYPPNYSTDQTIDDMKGVSKFLGALEDSFGKIYKPTENSIKTKIISLQIGGGDLPYWQKHPDYITKIFPLNFQNLEMVL